MTRIVLLAVLLTQAACADVLLIAAVHEALEDDYPPSRADKVACERWLAENPEPPPPADGCLDVCTTDPQWDYHVDRTHCLAIVQRYEAWAESVREVASEPGPRASSTP